MAILLIILGCVGWIIDINQWFIIPPIIYKGLLLGGMAWLIVSIFINLTNYKKINKHF